MNSKKSKTNLNSHGIIKDLKGGLKSGSQRQLPRKSPVPIPRWIQNSQQFLHAKNPSYSGVTYINASGMNRTFHNNASKTNIHSNSNRSLSPITRVKDQTPKLSPNNTKPKVSKSPMLSQSTILNRFKKFHLISQLNNNYNRNSSKSGHSRPGTGNEKRKRVDDNYQRGEVSDRSRDSFSTSKNNINIIKVNCNNNGANTISASKLDYSANSLYGREGSKGKLFQQRPLPYNSGINNPSLQASSRGNVSNKNRSHSTSAPNQFEEIIKNKQSQDIQKLQQYKQPSIPQPIMKRIRDIHQFTHVGFDGEQDKANNQDRAFVEENFAGNENYFYMSVCDGHGVEGHEVSGYIKKILPKDMSRNLYGMDLLNGNLKKKIHEIIKETFIDANEKLVDNQKINSAFSGSTCVSVIYTPQKLICPNIGDSRAVLGKYNSQTNKWTSVNLSRDHKPTEKDEERRIIENGGRIQPFIDEDTGEFIGPQRVWLKEEDFPGLAMTRSFGDRVAATVGVMSEPEIIEYDFKEEDKFFLIASDGVWEFIDSEECVNIIKDYYLSNDMKGCCDYLYLESKKRWIKEEEVVDDITMILVFLD